MNNTDIPPIWKSHVDCCDKRSAFGFLKWAFLLFLVLFVGLQLQIQIITTYLHIPHSTSVRFPEKEEVINDTTTPITYGDYTFTDVESLAAAHGTPLALAQEIMRCESQHYDKAVNENWTHETRLDEEGNEYVYAYIWSRDWGPWQINDHYHKGRMASMGLDIYNVKDSLKYGFILFSEQGTDPWSASKYCWGHMI